MPSYDRDPRAPAPNRPLRVGGLAAQDVTPAHRAIVERFLGRPDSVVVE